MKLVTTEKKIAVHTSNHSYLTYVKPLLDMLVAVPAFIFLLPIFVVVVIFVKQDSPGPVIFKQPRIGKDGKEFQIYKFRTMYVDVPKEGRSPTDDHDSRITRVGRFLRKTSLDELPQLLNIIKGDMSWVGPRPEQKSIVEEHYSSFERQRFLVRPGITGLWQISEHRKFPIHENLQHDFRYIREVSLWLDSKIIVKTVLVMFKSNTF